jgi:hypothetical protein
MRPESESQTVQKIENPTAVDKDGCRCRCSCCCCKVGGREWLCTTAEALDLERKDLVGAKEAAATARRENHQSKGPPFHWFLRTLTIEILKAGAPRPALPELSFLHRLPSAIYSTICQHP